MTKSVFSGWDAYARRALWGPAGITVVPALALSAYWVSDFAWIGTAASLMVSLGLAACIAEWVRPLGRRTEKRLVSSWGGLPTTRALRRFDGVQPSLRKQRRRDVEAVSGCRLPTKSEERSNPVEATERYEQAVYSSIARIRETGIDVGRLNAENASYGFRRNARALKGFALAVLASTTFANLYLAVIKDQMLVGVITLILQIFLACFWSIVVRDQWVTEQAETYAKRFFITVGIEAGKELARQRS